MSNLPIYSCTDHGIWLKNQRPPKLYAPVTPLPQVPDMFEKAAQIIYQHTLDRATVVACSDEDHRHFEAILIVYDPAHRDVQYRLFPRNEAEQFCTSFTSRTVQCMVMQNAEVGLPKRLAFAAWVLWSWFTLEDDPLIKGAADGQPA